MDLYIFIIPFAFEVLFEQVYNKTNLVLALHSLVKVFKKGLTIFKVVMEETVRELTS